jgi:hypothetical protein
MGSSSYFVVHRWGKLEHQKTRVYRRGIIGKVLPEGKVFLIQREQAALKRKIKSASRHGGTEAHSAPLHKIIWMRSGERMCKVFFVFLCATLAAWRLCVKNFCFFCKDFTF